MKNELSWQNLHDATLVQVQVLWQEARVVVQLRTGIIGYPEAQIVATSFRHFACPRRLDWGPSVSIHEVIGPAPLAEPGVSRLEIEMQSGDRLALEAARFALEATGAGPS
jgi:hypothetical protein